MDGYLINSFVRLFFLVKSTLVIDAISFKGTCNLHFSCVFVNITELLFSLQLNNDVIILF